MTIWIACLNLRGCRLFGWDDATHSVSFVRDLPRPRQLLRTADFDQDEDIPEITSDPNRYQRELAVAHRYSEQVARELESEQLNQSFALWIACAEPQLLQIFTAKLKPELRSALLGTVPLDLYDVNESDLLNYIEDILRRRPKTAA